MSAASITHGRFHPAGAAGAALERSSNWSGYAVTGASYRQVTGSWTVPTVRVTTSNGYAADWVGIGGDGSQDLIQAGTSEESVNHHATYYAWTEILPAPEVRISGFAIHPGDAVTVDVSQAGVGSWRITLTDHTSGQSYSKSLAYASTNRSAEWIHEAPTVGGTQARLAATSNANFDLGSVNGGPAIGSAGTRHAIQLIGSLDSTPSGLDGDADGFAVADGSAAPPPPPS